MKAGMIAGLSPMALAIKAPIIGIMNVNPRPPMVLSTQASEAIWPSPGATLGAPNWAMMEPMAMSTPPPMTNGRAAETPAMR